LWGILFFLAFHRGFLLKLRIGKMNLLEMPGGLALMLFLWGFFFWLYKGMILALPVLIAAGALHFRKIRQWAAAVLVLAAGSVPPLLYHVQYGFYLHYLTDSDFDRGPTWFNVFFPPQFQGEAFQFPLLPVVFKLLYVACFVYLAAKAIRWKKECAIVVFSLLAVPLLTIALLALSHLSIADRFYTPLYPIILATIVAGLASIRKVESEKFRKVVPVAVALLLVFTVPFTLSLIRPDRPGLFLRYQGDRYVKASIRYVPAKDVDWVNAWLKNCPDLQTPLLLFWTKDTPIRSTYSVAGLEKWLDSTLAERTSARLAADPPTENEARLLGTAMAFHTKKDKDAFDRFLSSLSIDGDIRSLLLQGFSGVDLAHPGSVCPTPTMKTW